MIGDAVLAEYVASGAAVDLFEREVPETTPTFYELALRRILILVQSLGMSWMSNVRCLREDDYKPSQVVDALFQHV